MVDLTDLKTKEQANCLFDHYQRLFSVTEQAWYQAYFYSDWSLQEISEHYQVSRAAVSERLHRIVTKLFNYEQVLHLYQKDQARLKLYHQYQTKPACQELIKALKAIDDKPTKA